MQEEAKMALDEDTRKMLEGMTRQLSDMKQTFDTFVQISSARDRNTNARLTNGKIRMGPSSLEKMYSVVEDAELRINQEIPEFPAITSELPLIKRERCKRILDALQVTYPENIGIQRLQSLVARKIGIFILFATELEEDDTMKPEEMEEPQNLAADATCLPILASTNNEEF